LSNWFFIDYLFYRKSLLFIRELGTCRQYIFHLFFLHHIRYGILIMLVVSAEYILLIKTTRCEIRFYLGLVEGELIDMTPARCVSRVVSGGIIRRVAPHPFGASITS
jgi:hypothetical protein